MGGALDACQAEKEYVPLASAREREGHTEDRAKAEEPEAHAVKLWRQQRLPAELPSEDVRIQRQHANDSDDGHEPAVDDIP